MLHTIDGTMQLIHADVADLNFFSKSAIAAKYCLLFVDLFSSKVYTYRMKKKATCRKTRKVLFGDRTIEVLLKICEEI